MSDKRKSGTEQDVISVLSSLLLRLLPILIFFVWRILMFWGLRCKFKWLKWFNLCLIRSFCILLCLFAVRILLLMWHFNYPIGKFFFFFFFFFFPSFLFFPSPRLASPSLPFPLLSTEKSLPSPKSKKTSIF